MRNGIRQKTEDRSESFCLLFALRFYVALKMMLECSSRQSAISPRRGQVEEAQFGFEFGPLAVALEALATFFQPAEVFGAR